MNQSAIMARHPAIFGKPAPIIIMQKTIAHTRAEWTAINYPKKSAGHIFFIGDIEYIQLERNVYACNRNDPVECTGTRNGKFVSTVPAWFSSPMYLAIVEERAKELDRILDKDRLQRFQASGSDAPAPVQMYERP